MHFRHKWITNEDESENYSFTFRARARGEFTIRAHLSSAGIHYSDEESLAGINFHNIRQVGRKERGRERKRLRDTPRERTDPASGNDHPRFVLHTSLRNKCRRSIIIMKITICNLKLYSVEKHIYISTLTCCGAYFRKQEKNEGTWNIHLPSNTKILNY